ncbi:MAG: transporter substrate-binding domain-containing protein [Burkholderiaceae bacterium]|nr:transporter substrate-binding domain-containing protein [Burkholderiaceae bacterium]
MALLRGARLCVCALVALSGIAMAQPLGNTLNFAVTSDDRFSRTLAQRVLIAAYKELGIEVSFTPLPIRRGYALAEAGEVDGLGMTVSLELTPSLRRVEVPIAYEETVVWATRRDFVPNGFASLQPYLVGHIAGVRYFEQRLHGLRTDPATNLEALFRKLELGRTDVVTESRFNGCLVKQLGLNKVVLLQPSLEVLPGYHFLHSKHAALQPRITAVLRRMEAEGSIKKIHAAAMREYQAQCS